MATSSTNFVLFELQERVARAEASSTRRRAVHSFGVPEIDHVLPGGGLKLGALHEVAGGANGAAAALWAAAWISASRQQPYPLQQFLRSFASRYRCWLCWPHVRRPELRGA